MKKQLFLLNLFVILIVTNVKAQNNANAFSIEQKEWVWAYNYVYRDNYDSSLFKSDHNKIIRFISKGFFSEKDYDMMLLSSEGTGVRERTFINYDGDFILKFKEPKVYSVFQWMLLKGREYDTLSIKSKYTMYYPVVRFKSEPLDSSVNEIEDSYIVIDVNSLYLIRRRFNSSKLCFVFFCNIVK